MKIPRHGHPAVNLHRSTAGHTTASPTLHPVSVPLRNKGGSPKPHSHINGLSLETCPLPTLPLPTWRMGCFQIENMLNFLIRKVCSSGSGWDGPSLYPPHPALSEPWWVGDPGGIGTTWAARSSLPSAVGCTSQASPAVLPLLTAQPPG